MMHFNFHTPAEFALSEVNRAAQSVHGEMSYADRVAAVEELASAISFARAAGARNTDVSDVLGLRGETIVSNGEVA